MFFGKRGTTFSGEIVALCSLRQSLGNLILHLVWYFRKILWNIRWFRNFGAVFWNFLSLEITVHGTHEPRLSVLKVCIWEGLTLFYNPQLGIPWHFVLKEISGREVRWACGEKWHFFGKRGTTFSGEIAALCSLRQSLENLILHLGWHFRKIFWNIRWFRSFGAVFWNFLSLEITVHGTHEPRLSVLKVCIWEGLTPFYNPQLGIPWHFVLKEISGREVRWACGEKWHFVRKTWHNFFGRDRSAL